MPTIIGPTTITYPKTVYPPAVFVRRNWSDEWQYVPELELIHARMAASGQDLSSAEFRYRYGQLKHPWESTDSARRTVNLAGWWVKLAFLSDQGLQPQWLGRFSADARDVHGAAAYGPSGRQMLVAYGPGHILRRTFVSRSYWKVGDEVRELGWVPSINDRDGRGLQRGNRSEDPDEEAGCHLYGGEEVWTHKQYAEYILAKFLDQSDDGGPAWALGGQVELLENLEETIRMAESQSAWDILRALCPPRLGMDFTVFPGEVGFTVWVYSLQSEEVSFGGATLPKNPNTVRIATSQSQDNIRTHLVQADEHRYGRIRVIGRRIVVCGSLYGEVCTNEPDEYVGSQVAKWSPELEAAYKDGTGTASDTPEKHDEARTSERFRPVYQMFGAPDDWDHHQGKSVPAVDAAGNLIQGAADFQHAVRATLSWLPLQEGFDYSVSPPSDHNPDWHTPDQLPPLAFLPATSWEQAITQQKWRYVAADKAGVGVSALRNDWGVLLSAEPNHLLGYRYFAYGTADPSMTAPRHDHKMIVTTIAWESDQRLALEHRAPGSDESDGTLDIHVPDAEMWVLAPRTAVGIDTDGTLKKSGPDILELRNDRAHLCAVMAGAIARYQGPRCRAEITVKGLLPWGLLVGQILTHVSEGGDLHNIQAPITSVEWSGGDNPITVIRTGYAH